MNLDHIMPILAPLLRRVLRSKQAQRQALFAAVPQVPGRVVFFGDSITELGAWEDWFPEHRTANRGIGGEAVGDLLARLNTAIVEPKAVSLLVGTNDLHGLGRSAEIGDIADQMDELVRRVRENAPSAPLLVNSVLPRSAHFRDRIIALNTLYRQIAARHGATYVDVWPALADENGVMRREMTSDGLHLSNQGYQAWTGVLRPYLAPLA